MIREQVKEYEAPGAWPAIEMSSNVMWEQRKVTRQVYLPDGDNLCHGLSGDLGFSEQDRRENIRRVGYVARLMYDAGITVICSFISPWLHTVGAFLTALRYAPDASSDEVATRAKREVRDVVSGFLPEGAFKEVHIQCDLEECKRRDSKRLY
jgi:adenylylsulfate kinase-like enzyme